MRKGLPLRVARDVSRGDERIFREALQQAKLELQTALGTLTTGFKTENTDLVRTANQIGELVDNIIEQMERKRKPKKKRRLAEDDDNV